MNSQLLAQAYCDRRLSGTYLTEHQGNLLYQMAQRERLVSQFGQREAAGTLVDRRTWMLTRVVDYIPVWLFRVLPADEQEQAS